MSGPVGVGVVGAGKISDQYLANMAEFPDLDVRFVGDLRPDAARAQAEAFGVPGHGTAEECLARDDVELVLNLTVPVAHAEVTSAALAAGKHVWTEKPITLDLASAEALVAQAADAGLLLGSAPDTILGPGLQTVRRVISSGAIGTPLTASVVMQYAGPHLWHPNPDFLFQTGAGPLFDMGPYYLTALTQVLGPITRVAARGGSAGPTRVIGSGPRAGEEIPVEVPTYVAALYDFASEGVASATFSFDSPLKRTGVVEIAGTEATIAAPDPNNFTGEVPDHPRRRRVGVGRGHGRRGRPRHRRRRHGAGDPRRREPSRDGAARAARARRHARHAGVDRERRVRGGGTTFDPVAALPEGWDPTEATL